MRKYLALSLLALLVYFGCTKDDICSEDTPTTPQLVIEFRDINSPLEVKAVDSLRIVLDDDDLTEIYVNTETDTLVSIPLNAASTTTRFLFTVKASLEDPNNLDTITFTYSTVDTYINRACAFKRTFNDFLVSVEAEGTNENWIRNYEILNPIIENENEAHLTIFH